MTIQQLNTEGFTTKDGYLAWRTAWRAEYKKLSAAIRLQKLMTKDCQRNPAVDWNTAKREWIRARPWTPEEQKRVDTWTETYTSYKGDLAAQATALLERRKWSKEEAQRQYLALKQLAA
jgi:hypothetical protein